MEFYQKAIDAVERNPADIENQQIVLKGLRDSSCFNRTGCTEALEYFGSEKHYGILSDLMKDRSWMVRASAITALAETNGKRSIPLAIHAMNTDKITYVRAYAAAALGRFKSTEVKNALIARLTVEKARRVLPVILHSLTLISGEEYLSEWLAWISKGIKPQSEGLLSLLEEDLDNGESYILQNRKQVYVGIIQCLEHTESERIRRRILEIKTRLPKQG